MFYICFSNSLLIIHAALTKPEHLILVRWLGLDCLVPRPQYYASVTRFGLRGPGRKVWPRQKSEKSHFFTEPILVGGNSLSISGSGTAREKHFKPLAFGLMLIG